MRISVLVCAGLLFCGWFILHIGALISDQNDLLRLVLTLLFSLLILFRRKRGVADGGPRSGLVLAAGGLGVALTIGGLVFSVGQFEWLGILLLLYACLRWALPAAAARDVLPALVVLYWAHPLPGRMFGGMQLAMQRMSVVGSEWLLHMLNVRVWADGLLLRTGLSTFEVPAWCSGMRTATTVFLLALGLGILKRLKPVECLVLVVAAPVQALILNVLRISAMAALAPRTGAASGAEFLHDTAAWVVIAGVGLVYVELLLWDRHKRERAAMALTPDAREVWQRSEYPPFWRWLIIHRTALVLGIFFAALGAGLVFRSRPYHRAQMLKDVAVLLRDGGDLEGGERLARTICGLVPEDVEWRFETLRMLVMRGKHEEVLAELAKLPADDGVRGVEARVLEAYSLMGLGRLDEAGAVVEGLPESVKSGDPRVAMVIAEIGCRAGNPDRVAESVVVASRWLPNTSRVRALYPYLRRRRRWRAIAGSDVKMEYRDAGQAMAAAEAYMNLDLTSLVAGIAIDGIARWPDDQRLLEPLYYMALRRDDGVWEARFAQQLGRSIVTITDINSLNRLFVKCAALTRPDLIWVVYDRIRELDDSHPALYMALARYGGEWFTFRRRRLGMNAQDPGETVDLAAMYLLAGTFGQWREVCNLVPHGRELALSDRRGIEKLFADLALGEFRKREQGGTLSDEMYLEYIRATAMSGDIGQAIGLAEKLAAARPALAGPARLLVSEIHERRGDWEAVYETLRGYEDEKMPGLHPLLLLCAAQAEMRLSLASLHSARRAVAVYPESSTAAAMLGRVLLMGNMPEDALRVLETQRSRRQRLLDVLETGALYMTQRYSTMQDYCRARLLPAIPVNDEEQRLVLPPAELAAMWQRTSIPSEQDFAYNANALRLELKRSRSPFLRRLSELWLERYAGGTADRSGEAGLLFEEWLRCGRDRVEKATALNQLTLLLCREKRFAEARIAAGMATGLLPESPVLWCISIGLSGGDTEVVSKARQACPDDSEIWLAELVVGSQGSGEWDERTTGPRDHGTTGEWDERTRGSGPAGVSPCSGGVVEMVKEAVASGAFTPAAMVRAGDYLLRGGMTEAGTIAVKGAITGGRGLVPAFVLGLRCALEVGDRDWAEECARNAVGAMLRPPAFLNAMLVQIKSSGGTIGTEVEMVEALKALRREYPDDPGWAQMSACIRFKRGGWEAVEAVSEMTAAIEAGATNRTVYLVGAEAARRVGNHTRSVELLRAGLQRHPGDLAMLNNLAFVLADMEDGVAEAVEIVDTLLRRADDDPDVLDTAAVVFIKAGRLDAAGEVLDRMLGFVKDGSGLWFRGWMHMAEIALLRGEPARAKSLLEMILGQSRGVPNEDLIEANRLLERCEPPPPSTAR